MVAGGETVRFGEHRADEPCLGKTQTCVEHRHSRQFLRVARRLGVTTAATSFPGGVERSLTQKPWRPGKRT
jgi:hypothetical protein